MELSVEKLNLKKSTFKLFLKNVEQWGVCVRRRNAKVCGLRSAGVVYGITRLWGYLPCCIAEVPDVWCV